MRLQAAPESFALFSAVQARREANPREQHRDEDRVPVVGQAWMSLVICWR